MICLWSTKEQSIILLNLKNSAFIDSFFFFGGKPYPVSLIDDCKALFSEVGNQTDEDRHSNAKMERHYYQGNECKKGSSTLTLPPAHRSSIHIEVSWIVFVLLHHAHALGYDDVQKARSIRNFRRPLTFSLVPFFSGPFFGLLEGRAAHQVPG